MSKKQKETIEKLRGKLKEKLIPKVRTSLYIEELIRKVSVLEEKINSLEEAHKFLLSLLRERTYYTHRNKPLKDLIRLIKKETNEIKDLIKSR